MASNTDDSEVNPPQPKKKKSNNKIQNDIQILKDAWQSQTEINKILLDLPKAVEKLTNMLTNENPDNQSDDVITEEEDIVVIEKDVDSLSDLLGNNGDNGMISFLHDKK
jgi:hypothetical protein